MATLVSVIKSSLYDVPEKFTLQDVFESVKKTLPNAKINSIKTCVQRDLKNKGIIKIVGKKGRCKLYSLTKVQIDSLHNAEITTANGSDVVVGNADQLNKPQADEFILEANQIGEAFVIYVNKLRDQIENLNRQIGALKINLSDAEIKLQNETKQWRQTLKEKDNTIAKLNRRMVDMNFAKSSRASLKFPISELARFKKLQNGK